MPVIEGYRFAVDLEDRGLLRGLKEIKNESQALKNVMKANFAELKNGEGSFAAYDQRIKDAQRSIDTYKIAIDKLNNQIDAWNAKQHTMNGESEKLNRQILRAKSTIARYRISMANLQHQIEADTLAAKRAATGIDSLRKSTQGIVTSNKALIDSLKMSGKYYASNRAQASGLKAEGKALTSQLQAEATVTKQLGDVQKQLLDKINNLKASVQKWKADLPQLSREVEKNKQALKEASQEVASTAKKYGAYDLRLEEAQKKETHFRNELEKSQRAFRVAQQGLKEAPGRLQGLNEALGKNAKTLGNQANATQKVAQKLKDVQKESRRLSNTKLGSFYSATSAKINRFNESLKQSTSNTRKWWQESKEGMGVVTLAVGGVTAGMAKAVSDAAEVQKKYIETKNLFVTSGESVRQSLKATNQMQSDGIKYSEQYGFAQKEIGEQYEELARRGYSSKAALGSMNSMLKASRASGDDLADVVKVTAQAVDAFGLRVDNAGKMMANTNRVANAMASGADRTASGFQDMGIAMGYVSGSAKTVGWNVEQASAAIGVLSNRGLEGSRAGTGLRKVINSLIKPTDDAEKALSKIGISVSDFTTQSGKLKDVDEVFKLINQHTQDMTKTEKGAFFKTIFGSTGQQAAQFLAQSAGGLKANDDELTKLIGNIKKDEKSDYIGRLAKKNMQSAQMQIERLKRTAEAFELSIGAAVLPAVNKVGNSVAKWAVSKEGKQSIQEFSSAAGKLADKIASHTQDVIAFGSGLVSGVKGAYHFIKPLTSALGKVVGFFDKSNTGSTQLARNVGKVVGFFGTAAIGLKVVKTLFGGIFAISKDTVTSTYKFVNWIRGGSKAQRNLNTQIKETNLLLKESISLQAKLAKEKGLSTSSKNASSSSNDFADTLSDIADMSEGKTKSKVVGNITKDAEKAGEKSAHFWQRGWLGKIAGFNKRFFAKLDPRNWTNTFAKLGDKAGNGFNFHLFKRLKGIGLKIKGLFKPRSWTQTFANLGDKAGEKFVKVTSNTIRKSNGKIKFSALFREGSKVAEKEGGTAGLGWARRLAAKIGDAHVASKSKWLSFFGKGTTVAEESGTKGAIGFLGNFGSKLAKGAGILGAAWQVASVGIDIVKGIRSHNPEQKQRAYGGAVGGVLGGAIGAALGGPPGALIGAGIGQAIGHATPEIIKWGKKSVHFFGQGWHNSMTWLHQLITGDFKGIQKGWDNFWGGMGNWFDQTFGVDNGKKSSKKSTTHKKTSVTSKIIHTGVKVSKKDVANVKAMSKALTTYASSLKRVKTELKNNNPSNELNKVNDFLKSHTKQWTAAAGPIKQIGDAFKYLSKFAASVAKKDAFAAFNKDLPKLDSTLKTHGKSIKKGINDLTDALKGGKGKHSTTLLERFQKLGSGAKTLGGKLKDLNSYLKNTAGYFKDIQKVTKEFTGKKNPLKSMADGFTKLKNSLKSNTKEIEADIKKLKAAFQGKKGSTGFADVITKASKPLKEMSSSFKSMAKSVPPISKGIKSIDSSVHSLTKGKNDPINKLANNFDTLKSHLKKDSDSIVSHIKNISSSFGGKTGFNARASSAKSITGKLSDNFKTLASKSTTLASNLKSANSSLNKLTNGKKNLDGVTNSIKQLSDTIKSHPFGDKINDQVKSAIKGLTGKGSISSRFNSMASSVSSSTTKMTNATAKFKSNVSSTFTSLKSTVTSTFNNMWKQVKKDTVDGLNDVIDEVNDAVDNINDSVDSMNDADSKHKAKHASHVHLAEGTNWQQSINKPTLAILNDGNDSPETQNREGLLHSNGTLEYLKGRNILRMLLPGDEVIKASDMAKLTKVPKYAKGTTIWGKAESFNQREHVSKELLEIAKKSFNLDKEEAKRKREEARKNKNKKSRNYAGKSITAKNLDYSGKTVYLDTGYFSKSGDRTGKIIAVSKRWLDEFKKMQVEAIRKIGRKTKTRHRSTTRRRTSSSSTSKRKSSSNKSFTWRKSKYGNWYRDYYQPVSSRSRSRSSSSQRSTTSRATSSSVTSRVQVSVSGEGQLKTLASEIDRVKGNHKVTVQASASGKSSINSLNSSINKVKGTHKAKVTVTYSGTYKAKASIDRLLKSIGKLKKTKTVNLKVKYSGTWKAKESFDRLTKAIKSTSSKMKSVKSSSHSAGSALKSLGEHVTSTHSRINSLYKALKKEKFGDAIKKQAEEAVKSLKGKGNFAKEFKSLTDKFKSELKSLVKASKSEFKELWDSIESRTKSGKDKTIGYVGQFKNSFQNAFKSMQNGTQTAYSKFWKTMESTAGTGVNNVLKVLNKGIGKIDDVISEFGGNKTAVHKVDLIRLATGTGYFSGTRRKIDKPTLAILNDGNDSPETQNKETIWDTRNNTFGVVQGRNTPFLLHPGQEVLNATESKQLGFTHFATGTGALKKLYEMAKHYWNKPAQTGNSMFGKITGLIGAINQIANGMLKSGKKQGVEWWSQLWKMVEDKVNDDGDSTLTGLVKAMAKNGDGKIYQWGASGPNEFDCSGLVMYTLKKDYGIDYPHFSGSQYNESQHISRSEAKPGDLVFWGPDDHVGVYAGGNKYYSAYGPNGTHGIGMMPLSSVVGHGKPLFARVRGLKQDSSKHEEVKANTKLQKLIKNQVGKGFWKTIAKIADKYGEGAAGNVKLTGDLTQKSLQLAKALKHADPKATAKGIAALISNAITESTLNPGITNSIGATGLWQFYAARRAGLESYSRSHHGNYHNAGMQIDYALHGDSKQGLFKQILEGNGSPYNLAYQFSRQWEVGGYDDRHASHANSLYKLLKNHGYANGGIADRASIFGEAGPEMAIPLSPTKSDRAFELVGKTIAILSKQSGNHLASIENTKEQKEEHKFRQDVILLLRQLLAQGTTINTNFEIDGRNIFKATNRYFKEDQRRTSIQQRRGLSGHF